MASERSQFSGKIESHIKPINHTSLMIHMHLRHGSVLLTWNIDTIQWDVPTQLTRELFTDKDKRMEGFCGTAAFGEK